MNVSPKKPRTILSKLAPLKSVVLISFFSIAIALPSLAQDNGGTKTAKTTGLPSSAQQSLLLEEYKCSAQIEIGPTVARLLKLNHRIIRTSISDPGIANPVVISAHEVMLVGRRSGTATLTIWDDAGNYKSLVVLVKPGCDPSDAPMRVTSDRPSHLRPPERLESQLASMRFTINVAENLDPAVQPAAHPPYRNTEKSTDANTSASYIYDVLPPVSDSCDTPRFSPVPGGTPREHDDSDTVLEIEQHCSRTFKTNHSIVRFSSTDPKIAEPIVIACNKLVLLGKSPGTATLALWDDAGNIKGFEVKVRSPIDPALTIIKNEDGETKTSSSNTSEPAIPTVNTGAVDVQECRQGFKFSMAQSQAELIGLKAKLIRASTSNPDILSLLPRDDHRIYLWSRAPGKATVFLWNDCGNLLGISVDITAAQIQAGKVHIIKNDRNPKNSSDRDVQNKTLTLIPPFGRSIQKVEIWSGARKDVWEFPQEPTSTAILQREDESLKVHNLRGPSTAREWHRAITNDTTLDRCKTLCNEAIKLISKGNYKAAISKLVAALYADERYQTAFDYLAAAYNSYGDSLRDNPQNAIEQFHNAVYVNARNKTVSKNLEDLIRSMGRDPDNFNDRVTLGDEASRRGDITGSVIEYESALQIKEDFPVRERLAQAYRRLDDAQDEQSLHADSIDEGH